jgi:ribosomal protein S18 acetylase RimI-like enzyme
MTSAEFEAWRPAAVESFAANLARALDRPIEAARARAAAQLVEELPDGLASSGHQLFVIVDDEHTEVGTLWLGPHPQRSGAAYVYDLEIAAGFRRRGFGRAAMAAAEQAARASGMAEIALNVFGFNEPARLLYESAGYEVTSIQMRKPLR